MTSAIPRAAGKHAQANGRGAYGLAFQGLADEPRLVNAPESWPTWTIASEGLGGRGGSPAALPGAAAAPAETQGGEEWGPERARLKAVPGGWVLVERRGHRTVLQLPRPPSPEALLHPYLASTAVVAGHWLGRTPMHAGGVVVGGRVWGLLGDRAMGKTSTLMGLHQLGLGVFTDDVLVVDGSRGVAFCGPRCLDLRADAARRFDEGRPIGVVGRRERWRVDLPPLEAELPLAGWVVLAWSSNFSLEIPSAPARLATLFANRGLLASEAPTDSLLDLVGYPMLCFARPSGWDAFEPSVRRLHEALAQF